MKNERGITTLTIIIITFIFIIFAGTAIVLLNNDESDSKKETKKETKTETKDVEEEKNKETPNDVITEELGIATRTTINKHTTFGVYINTNEEFKEISISAEEFGLPEELIDYSSDISLRVTYSEDDFTVYDCKVINKKTGEILEDLSEKNLRKLFDIEYNKKIIKKDWTDTIYLSELKENEIYQYIPKDVSQMPQIINDIGENCIVHIKENEEDAFFDSKYEKEIKMHEEVDSPSASVSFHEIENSINIMYETINNEDLLKLIEEDDIINLSEYKSGDELSYQFEKYIYNDTKNDITLYINDNAFGMELNDTITLEAGKIYGFDWMIDSITITY